MDRQSGLDTAGVKERTFLVALDTGDDGGWTAEESLAELAALVETAGGEVVGTMSQARESMHPLWYVGSGKAKELKVALSTLGFDLLVTDDELSPKQQRALEKLLDVRVIDRSGVILDIFAQRAQTHEGRLQVELAQLEYQLPRLTRLWTHLSRTGGGGAGSRAPIGAKGPGETQLETDRRVIRARIKKLKQRVAEVRVRRDTASGARNRRLLPSLAIVGYTNAGKSTLLNALVGKHVVASEDMLFATLDPTSRKIPVGGGQAVIVSDTVGFIHKLPHQLVDAFRATLEEVVRADVLIEVVDAADSHAREHRGTVQSVLDELGAGHKPRVLVYNKIDLVERHTAKPFAVPPGERHAVAISAKAGLGLDDLRQMVGTVLAELWTEVDVGIPYSAGSLLARARERGAVDFDYLDTEVRVHGRVDPALAGELAQAARSWKRSLKQAEVADGRSRAGGARESDEPASS